MICFLNGKFLAEEDAMINVFDHGFYFGDGIYETMRTVNGELWQGEKHMERLFTSAKMIFLKIPWSSGQIIYWINECIKRNNFKESRIRLTISRGRLDLSFEKGFDPTILIKVDELQEISEDILKNGVDLVTMEMERIMPKAKTLNLMSVILAYLKEHETKAYEVLLVNREGFITEGAITNYFVVKDGILMTPNEDILYGTVRDRILEIAEEEGIKVVFKSMTKKDILECDECFICNAPRGIVPVRSLDEERVGEVEKIERQTGDFLIYSHV